MTELPKAILAGNIVRPRLRPHAVRRGGGRRFLAATPPRRPEAWRSIPAFPGPGTGRLLAALLVAVVLLCHGVFGAAHLIYGAVAYSPPAGEHAAGHPPDEGRDGAGHGERPASHHADAGYFAVLVGILLGGPALWVLIRKTRRRDGIFCALRRFAGRPLAAIFKLARGPTPPLLQVFRL